MERGREREACRHAHLHTHAYMHKHTHTHTHTHAHTHTVHTHTQRLFIMYTFVTICLGRIKLQHYISIGGGERLLVMYTEL